MSQIFTLIIILLFSDGILSASRYPATSYVDGTHGQFITDSSAPSEYMKQQLKKYEESVGISHDYGQNPSSEKHIGSGDEMVASNLKQTTGESATYKPSEELNLSTKQNGLKDRKPKPYSKECDSLELNKPIGAVDKSISGGFALKVAAGMIEIDIEKSTTEIPGRSSLDNSTSNEASESRSSQLNEDDQTSESNKLPTEKSVSEEELSSGSITTADPIDEEIKKVLDTLPKLPKITLIDNNTNLGFHKDPEEAALDDRITQVARQLAETGLRQQYEEKKLGHYIPIRLRQYDEFPLNWYSSARKVNNDNAKLFINPFDIFFELRQEPPLRFKARQIPEHIYNPPVFISKNQSPSKSSTEVDNLSKSDEQVIVTEINPISKPKIHENISPSVDNTNILQIRPHFVISNPKSEPGNNRIPLIIDMTQGNNLPLTHYNLNDLNGYQYREIA